MAATVSQGASGPLVRELQGNLRRHGAPIKVDGRFGPATENAVREFQGSEQIPVDGVVGVRTWNALHRIAGKPHAAIEQPPRQDWSFEKMLKDVGAWVEENSPFANAKPGTSPPTLALGQTMRRPGSTASDRPAAKPAVLNITAPRVDKGADQARFRRITFAGYEGRGWLINGFESMRGQQVREFRSGKFAINPVGAQPFVISECVHLVKYYGVPYSGTWRRGPQVCDLRPGDLPIGTVIATMRDGSYHSDYSGRSHVGIYLGHDDYDTYLVSPNGRAGVLMLNQWNGSPIQTTRRPYAIDANALGNRAKKPWKDDKGVVMTRRMNWMKDGEEYFVVMTR